MTAPARSAYVVASLALGPVWIVPIGLLKPDWARSWQLCAGVSVASVIVAQLLKGHIERAQRWRLLGAAGLVLAVGHFVSTALLAAFTVVAAAPDADSPAMLLRAVVLTPLLGLFLTAPLLPLYLPLSVGYCYALRGVRRWQIGA